jgi:hypothetical protein
MVVDLHQDGFPRRTRVLPAAAKAFQIAKESAQQKLLTRVNARDVRYPRNGFGCNA